MLSCKAMNVLHGMQEEKCLTEVYYLVRSMGMKCLSFLLPLDIVMMQTATHFMA